MTNTRAHSRRSLCELNTDRGCSSSGYAGEDIEQSATVDHLRSRKAFTASVLTQAAHALSLIKLRNRAIRQVLFCVSFGRVRSLLGYHPMCDRRLALPARCAVLNRE